MKTSQQISDGMRKNARVGYVDSQALIRHIDTGQPLRSLLIVNPAATRRLAPHKAIWTMGLALQRRNRSVQYDPDTQPELAEHARVTQARLTARFLKDENSEAAQAEARYLAGNLTPKLHRLSANYLEIYGSARYAYGVLSRFLTSIRRRPKGEHLGKLKASLEDARARPAFQKSCLLEGPHTDGIVHLCELAAGGCATARARLQQIRSSLPNSRGRKRVSAYTAMHAIFQYFCRASFTYDPETLTYTDDLTLAAQTFSGNLCYNPSAATDLSKAFPIKNLILNY